MSPEEKRTATLSVLLPVLAVPVFAYVFLVSMWFGLAPFGNSYEAPENCIIKGGLPSGLQPQQAQETSTYWPLGLVCSGGGVTTLHQNWLATIGGYGSLVALVVAIVLALRAILRVIDRWLDARAVRG